MSLDQQLAHAVRHVAAGVDGPHVDVQALRARARARAARRRLVATVVTTTLATILLVTGFVLVDRGQDGVAPPAGTAPVAPMDTSSWVEYTSERYDLTIAHPPGWTVEPATRNWSWEVDAEATEPDGMDGFMAPEGDVFVTVFSLPLEPGQDSNEAILAWVEDYCQEWTEPCAGLDKRAVELCVGEQDCDSGLLVPFMHDVQAFFTGGPYDGRLVVVTVWRNDSNMTVQAQYGTFQKLLEGFLSTMDVRRAPNDTTQ
jgi:hypothetical protein